MDKQKYNDALNRAMALCSRYEKCVRDITEKLPSWGIADEKEVNMIIDNLIQNRFIDETRYTTAYSREKHRINHWGKIKIRVMLKSKGIAPDIIETALMEIDPAEYKSLLKDDLKRKKEAIKATNQYDLKGKLMRFARARGFETELIYNVISELTGS